MKHRMVIMLGTSLLVLIAAQSVAAQDLFYSGTITIDDIEVVIDIGDEAAISAVYVLTNRGDVNESVTLGVPEREAAFWEGDDHVTGPITFQSREIKTIQVRYTATVGGTGTRTLSFTPAITLNGAFHPKPPARVSVTVWLPEGVQKILHSNIELSPHPPDANGRVAYSWEEFNIYPTSFTILWSTQQLDLSVEKSASPSRIEEPNQHITVQLVIQNHGEDVIEDIVLMDDFVPSEFEGVEPMDEFWAPEVEESDPHLYWAKHIDELRPGEEMTVQYVLKYIGDTSMVYTIQLKPCRVTAGGLLVGVSDRVPLYQRVGVTIDTEMGVEAPAEEAGIPPTWLLIAFLGAALGIGLILAGAFIAWRRR
jgi:hypothetical protein